MSISSIILVDLHFPRCLDCTTFPLFTVRWEPRYSWHQIYICNNKHITHITEYSLWSKHSSAKEIQSDYGDNPTWNPTYMLSMWLFLPLYLWQNNLSHSCCVTLLLLYLLLGTLLLILQVHGGFEFFYLGLIKAKHMLNHRQTILVGIASVLSDPAGNLTLPTLCYYAYTFPYWYACRGPIGNWINIP